MSDPSPEELAELARKINATRAGRRWLLRLLLDGALDHVLDSPSCPASIAVHCAPCDVVIPFPLSGPITDPGRGCERCDELLADALEWRSERLGSPK